MGRYIVTPMLGMRGMPYYVITDTATGKGVEGYGCETWANHRAEVLNKDEDRHLEGWSEWLNTVNHAQSRRTAEQHDRDRKRVFGHKAGKNGRERHGDSDNTHD